MAEDQKPEFKPTDVSVPKETLANPKGNPILLWWNRRKPTQRLEGKRQENLLRKTGLIIAWSIFATLVVGTGIVLGSSILRRHILGLVAGAWAETLSKTSQTNLSVTLFLLAVPVTAFLIGMLMHPREHMTAKVRESFLPALIGLLVPVCGLGVVFMWSFAHTDYEQHKTLSASIVDLSTRDVTLTAVKDKYKEQANRMPERQRTADDLNARLEATLLLRIGGFQVHVMNNGVTPAKQVTVSLKTWQIGAPGPDIADEFPIRDLAPSDDFTLNIEPFRSTHDKDYDRRRASQPTCGQIVVRSINSSKPRGWAFFIPGQGQKVESFFYNHDPWPIIEFDYPRSAPHGFECVDHPVGICKAVGQTNWIWTP